MTKQGEIGKFVRSAQVPRQKNNPDITVVRLDLHEKGFVVRCEIGEATRLTPGGPVSLDLRDSLYTRYERAEVGQDFISYTPAIPQDAEWLKVLTRPETHIDLSGAHGSRGRRSDRESRRDDSTSLT
jgi:hypothetical protein